MPKIHDPADLYEACRSADVRRRSDAYQDLGRLLYRIALSRVGRDPRKEHLAADSVQESLATIWQRLQAGQGPERPASFVGWSARITINKLLDAQRRLEPTPRVHRSKRVALSRQVRLDAEDDEGHSLAERLADPDSRDIESGAEYDEIREVLLGIQDLDTVSDNSKAVLLKGYLAGWDDEELAADLDTSRGNVHVIRCRDLSKLRGDASFVARLRGHYE